MATNKPRFSITVSDDVYQQINEYQHEHRLPTQTKAVMAFIEKGLEVVRKEKKLPTAIIEVEQVQTCQKEYGLSSVEQSHIEKYRSLDSYGKEAVDGVLDVEYRRIEQAKVQKNAVAETSGTAIDLDLDKVIRYSVPGYSAPISAGTGEEAGRDYPENYTLVKGPPRGTSFIARVSGNSMEPTYYDGDLVFVHSVEEIPVGRIGAFFMDGQQWIKERGDGVLISHNLEYDPRPMTVDTRCQGLVLGVCDESYFE